MTEKTSLNVTFIFEPGRPWGNINQFKKDIAALIQSYGNYQGEVIEGVGEQGGSLIIMLTPTKPNLSMPKAPITFSVKK